MKTTKYVRELVTALTARNVSIVEEYSDGHKHVDIAIPSAQLFIEVDGMHHFTDPDQIIRDFKRDHYSDGDDMATIHIPNIVIEHYCEDIANAIAEVVRRRTTKR